jgi:hypothetical protein
MPIVPIRCPYCGAAATLEFSQWACGCDLHSWESLHCPVCGARREVEDDMREEHRAILLEEEGRWSIMAEGRPSVNLLKAARECLALSLADVAALKARLPGVLASGTRSEMEVLANRLRRAAGPEIPIQLRGRIRCFLIVDSVDDRD